MNIDFLTPVNQALLTPMHGSTLDVLGKSVRFHTTDAFPELSDVKVAIIGVRDGRGAVNNPNCGYSLDSIREKLYQLFPGNWNTTIADIGDILMGESISDTYFALSSTINSLLRLNIIPVIIGGGQDLTYANYRAYDNLEQTVNLVSVDSRFDIGNIDDDINSRSYLSKIILEQPNNLFNFSNIGYQTYFNSQEEIKLLENLYFDAYRLGAVKDITLVEPILRDADVVSVDIGAVRQSEAPGNNNASPNGFYGEDLCAIARYAGISDKVTSFGVYEYSEAFDVNGQTAHLIAQTLWYFIEGVNFRAKDYPYATKESYQKFIVMLDNDDPINFYKSDKSGRWWMEINLFSNTKHKRHTLIPCSYQDYEHALEQKIPPRWYKALQKLT